MGTTYNKRLKILEKCGFKCSFCGIKLHADLSNPYSNDYIQVDHILPRKAGGTHELSNLQAACKSCNSKKGARSSTVLMGVVRNSMDNAYLTKNNRDKHILNDINHGIVSFEELKQYEEMNEKLYRENADTLKMLRAHLLMKEQ